jgi:hypothetical protein
MRGFHHLLQGDSVHAYLAAASRLYPPGAAQPMTRWACGACAWLRSVERSVRRPTARRAPSRRCTPISLDFSMGGARVVEATVRRVTLRTRHRQHSALYSWPIVVLLHRPSLCSCVSHHWCVRVHAPRQASVTGARQRAPFMCGAACRRALPTTLINASVPERTMPGIDCHRREGAMEPR